uniref:Uncharacterized protein n=1 Tax=Anguilla anguilla TaxID=7936 RepID=A0A0E9SUN1_ANGAN
MYYIRVSKHKTQGPFSKLLFSIILFMLFSVIGIVNNYLDHHSLPH